MRGGILDHCHGHLHHQCNLDLHEPPLQNKRSGQKLGAHHTCIFDFAQQVSDLPRRISSPNDKAVGYIYALKTTHIVFKKLIHYIVFYTFLPIKSLLPEENVVNRLYNCSVGHLDSLHVTHYIIVDGGDLAKENQAGTSAQLPNSMQTLFWSVPCANQNCSGD